jgi:hypothetical protein
MGVMLGHWTVLTILAVPVVHILLLDLGLLLFQIYVGKYLI